METSDTVPTSRPSNGTELAPDGWLDALESLRSELVDGLLYTHGRVNADSSKLLETSAFLYAAIELLSERGLISVAELDERKKVVMQRLVKVFLKRGMGVILLEPEQDKYTYPEVAEVDCAARLHVCHAACCRLNFALSVQDVEEGVLRWELGDPYMSRREADGYCSHLDRETFTCTVREHRSIPCRAYTCRNDARIWKDFDRMEPVPGLDQAFRDRVAGHQIARLGKPRERVGEQMIEKG